MCGRYASSRGSLDLATLFEAVDETEGALVPDYNIAPTDPSAIARLGRIGTPKLSMARWGLHGSARMINARAETVATTRAFADAFARRRCLVPADGWYEWCRDASGRKQPYFMTRPEGLAFGGVWTMSGGAITFSIITLAARDELASVHDRMPLLVEPARWREWLVTDEPAAMLASAGSDYRAGIELRPVADAVGDVRNDGPGLVKRVATPAVRASSTVEPRLF